MRTWNLSVVADPLFFGSASVTDSLFEHWGSKQAAGLWFLDIWFYHARCETGCSLQPPRYQKIGGNLIVVAQALEWWYKGHWFDPSRVDPISHPPGGPALNIVNVWSWILPDTESPCIWRWTLLLLRLVAKVFLRGFNLMSLARLWTSFMVQYHDANKFVCQRSGTSMC